MDTTYILYYRNCVETAFVYYQRQDYASAVVYLERAFETTDKNFKMQAAFGLADCYEEMGDTLRAMPYYNLVKTHQEKQVVMANQNGDAMPMLNAYLSDKQRLEHRAGIVWVAIIVGLLALTAVVVLAKQKGRKMLKQQQAEAERALKAKDSQHELELKAKQDEALRQLEAARQSHEEEVKRLQATVEQSSQHQRDMLQQRVLAIYQTGGEDRLQRILDEFESAYPSATVRLQQACPNLNETECRIVILSFLGFRAKEAANLLGLKENTVTQYRSNLKKKADIDGLSASIG
jgi:DNA-binding CsgD family transcriptional regulator/heme exporter protein D